MKKILSACLCLVALAGLFVYCKTDTTKNMTNLEKRLDEYAYAIDYDFESPEKIYQFMTEDYKAKLSEEEFVKAFNKERSYPYITGLYISKPEIEVNDELTSGSAVYLQAARIIGMTYEVDFVYENDDYYIKDWEEFLDGSYLEKFEDVPYTLDWYYDPDNNTK